MNTAKLSGLALSPDEDRILFTSDASGIGNAYEVSISTRRQTQLTYSTSESIQSVSYFPKDRRILLSRDRDGVENRVLYVLHPDGSETSLTHGTRVQTIFHRWSADEESFYMSTNERDSRFYDLYQVSASDYSRNTLFELSDRFHCCAVSDDERYALFVKIESMAKADVYLGDISTKGMTAVISDDGDVLNCAPVFNRDGGAIYYVSDKGNDFRYVRRLDLLTGESTCVERAEGDVGWTFFSPDYQRRVSFFDEASTTRRVMRIHDEVTGEALVLPGFSSDSITSAIFSRSGRKLAFYVNGDRSPGNIYVYDSETGLTARVTESLNAEIDHGDLVESEVVRFHSVDDLEIPALLWRPHHATGDRKFPGLVWVHGGPGGRMAKGYKGRIQYLVNHGYVVLGVNYRGSSGFGKTFLSSDRLKHGREPLLDCVMAKQYLTTLDYVDSTKIGIIGASFGGFMVLAALTFAPDEFAVGVDICGPSNFLSLAHSLPAYWNIESFYDKLGDLDSGREDLKSISPVFFADRITRPLMILQGARDPRCPRQQSEEMVEAIRVAGGEVEYLLFDDEAHGFRKRKNAVYAFESILKFLDLNLKPAAVSAAHHEDSV